MIAVGADTTQTNGFAVPSWMKPKEKSVVRLPDAPKGWTRLSGCRIVEDKGKDRDGDSFYVKHNGDEYRFRLYFADCPETNTSFNRYVEQMRWFGVDKDKVLEYGEEAKEFTARALGRPFTVYTKWQDALGAGKTPREYALIFTAEGENLADILVKAGLARAFGEKADFPDKAGQQRMNGLLKDLEDNAKKEHLGIYRKAHAVPPVVAKTSVPAVPAAPPAPPVVAAVPSVPDAGKMSDAGVGKKALININTASKVDLMKLPGIGEVYADRIIAARPFASSEDVKRVGGIGPKKFEAIAQRVEAK